MFWGDITYICFGICFGGLIASSLLSSFVLWILAALFWFIGLSYSLALFNEGLKWKCLLEFTFEKSCEDIGDDLGEL